MASELLSVCIPTRNRARYLRELLSAFAAQIEKGKLGAADVAFYLSDNAAEDETPEVIREFKQRVPWTVASRNPKNIGGDENIGKVRREGQGQYRWVLGDDEILCDNALVKVLDALHKHQPGLLLAYSSLYDLRLPVPKLFSNYGEFARECIRCNVHALVEHSLLSSNIYRADCYDLEFDREKVATRYPQMYGMVRPLLRNKAGVFVPDWPIITVRPEPAPAVDGLWKESRAEANTGWTIDGAWVEYLTWLRSEIPLPELDPHAPSEYARKLLRKRMFTFRFIWNNRRALVQPQAYRFVLERLFRKRG